MKSFLYTSILALAFSALLLASCATKAQSVAEPVVAPAPVESPAATPAPHKVVEKEKVAKQRTVVTKVPVLVKEASFYSDGLPDEYIIYRMDEDKKNLLEKDVFDAARAEPIQRLLSEHKDGRLAAESLYESDGKLRSRRELAYDSAGHLLLERMLDAGGRVQSSSAYTYDSEGRKVVWRALGASDNVKAMTTYAYGSAGLAAMVMMDAGGRITGTIKLEYADGKLDKRSYLGAAGALQKFETFIYDGELLSAVEYHRADGSLASKTVNSYDSMGILAKMTEFDASGKPGAYSTYKYIVREDTAIETYYE